MTPDINTLKSLLARVEVTAGTDHELDRAIYQAFEGSTYGMALGDVWSTVGSYSGSIDAAVMLVQRVLPGWSWGVYRQTSSFASACNHAYVGSLDSGVPDATPALALLAALLRAMIVQAEAKAAA